MEISAETQFTFCYSSDLGKYTQCLQKQTAISLNWMLSSGVIREIQRYSIKMGFIQMEGLQLEI